MNLQRVAATASKEWREIVRDRLFFALVFGVPTMLMLVFGYGLTFDVENIPFAIIDHDGSSLSRDYAHRFIDSRYFDFHGYSKDIREIAPLIHDNELRAVVVIPDHFERDLLASRPVGVQTIMDGTFPFRAQTTNGYVMAINAAFTGEVLANFFSKGVGISQEKAARQLVPVSLHVRYLYNQSLKSRWTIAPVLMMVVLLIAPPFYTALGVVREKESGSIYNIYASTVSRVEFLVGKLLPYLGLSIFNALFLWFLAVFLFGAPFRGDPIFFFFATVLYVICTTGIGLLVSVLVPTQVAAMVVTAIVTLVPAVLYSGVLIPISSLSETAQFTAHLLPAMYYTNIVQGSFLKGTGLRELWQNVAVLIFYASVLLTVGYLRFQKRPNS